MYLVSKFYRRFLPVAVASILFFAGTNAERANAQSGQATLGTAYNISGTDTNGSVYTGTLAIKPSTGKTALAPAYELDWTIGNSTIRGLGVLHDGVLSVAYGTDGCNLFAILSQNQGVFAAVWANIADQQFGTEQVITSTAGETGPFQQTANVKGTNPNGSTYTGMVTMSETGILSNWTWKTMNNPYGIGILEPSTLTVAVAYQYKNTDECGVVSYMVEQGPGTLVGIWARVGSTGIGSEVAVPMS